MIKNRLIKINRILKDLGFLKVFLQTEENNNPLTLPQVCILNIRNCKDTIQKKEIISEDVKLLELISKSLRSDNRIKL